MTPKWLTPSRKARLVSIFQRSGGFCVHGHRPCPCPQEHHYEFFIEDVIRDWVLDDRAEREAWWQEERCRMHRDQRRIRQGRFDSVAREQFLTQQPQYYLEAMGVDALTFRPVAKVRIPSTGIRIFVDVGDAVRKVSKSARRKAARYGMPLPQTVDEVVQKAVEEWWAR